MSQLHVDHIKITLDRSFSGKIDLSDVSTRPPDEQRNAFLTRSVAAYALMQIAGIDEDIACRCIVDGYDDNGIDAIYINPSEHLVYLVQSKWMHTGDGSITLDDINKFINGFNDLIKPDFTRFNEKINRIKTDIISSLEDSQVKFNLIFSFTGKDPISTHVQNRMNDLIHEMNDPSEMISWYIMSQKELHDAVSGLAEGAPINLEFVLKDWGFIEDPFKAYYGQIEASDIAAWYSQYRTLLLKPNLRNFLGSTDVNEAIRKTLTENPENFWYFNNGITLLCNTVNKKPIGGPDRRSGYFSAEGVGVVNGAQTVGSIFKVFESSPDLINRAKVLVRFISLEGCPDSFGMEVTRATNTQNKIERRDFAAQDPEQHRLQKELWFDNIEYVCRTGETKPTPERGCDIEEATIALACANQDIGLAVQAKREVGKLWENIDREPYRSIFRPGLTGKELWNTVLVSRKVESQLKTIQSGHQGRERLIAVHGNRFLLHLLFKSLRQANIRELDARITFVDQETENIFNQVVQVMNANFESSYPANLFKNRTKCGELSTLIEQL